MYLVAVPGGDGLVARDLELGGDAVLTGVELPVAKRGTTFDSSFEGGVGAEVVMELVFAYALASAVLLVPSHGEPSTGDGIEKSG